MNTGTTYRLTYQDTPVLRGATADEIKRKIKELRRISKFYRKQRFYKTIAERQN